MGFVLATFGFVALHASLQIIVALRDPVFRGENLVFPAFQLIIGLGFLAWVMWSWWPFGDKEAAQLRAHFEANRKDYTDLLLELASDGVVIHTGPTSHTWKWADIPQIHDAPDHIFFLLRDDRSIKESLILPRRAFSDPAESNHFLARACALRDAALQVNESISAKPGVPINIDLRVDRIRYDLGWEDIVTLEDFTERTKPVTRSLRIRRLLEYVGAAIVGGFTILIYGIAPLVLKDVKMSDRILFPTMIVLMYGYIVWSARKWKGTVLSVRKVKQIQKEVEGNPDAHRNLELTCSPEGVTQATQTQSQTWRWAAIERLEVTPEHIFLFDTPETAIVVPRRAFESEERSNVFIDSARRWWLESRGERSGLETQIVTNPDSSSHVSRHPD